MHRCLRLCQLSSIAILALSSIAFAQETSRAPASDSADTGSAPELTPSGEASATPASEGEAAGIALPPAAALDAAEYGLAFRLRWISVPSWFLGLFTKKNMALSSYGYAFEGFRRKHDKDDPNHTWELSAAIGYQDMSPPDGYWLGKGKNPLVDADLVQARNFSLITMDVAFISRQYFSRYFGIHYGAGLGLAVVRGKILRTSATYNQAKDQYTVVYNGATICDPSAKCDESQLSRSEGKRDNGPTDPHRFEETSVPGAIPILNLLVGLDFPIPDAKGLEFRVEGGFYDAFFIGGTAGYVF